MGKRCIIDLVEDHSAELFFLGRGHARDDVMADEIGMPFRPVELFVNVRKIHGLRAEKVNVFGCAMGICKRVVAVQIVTHIDYVLTATGSAARRLCHTSLRTLAGISQRCARSESDQPRSISRFMASTTASMAIVVDGEFGIGSLLGNSADDGVFAAGDSSVAVGTV